MRSVHTSLKKKFRQERSERRTDMPQTEFDEVIREMELNYVGHCNPFVEQMANRLAVLVADAARELCFQYRQDHLSASTNNWEVAKVVRKYLAEKGD